MKKILFTFFTFLLAAQVVYAQPAIQNVRVVDKTNPALAVTVSAAGALKVDGSGGTQAISAVSLPLPAGASTSALQSTGNTSLSTIDTSTAATAASASVMDDWDESDRAKVNIIVGQAGVAAGTGTDSATTQRVSLATNVPLPAGTNNIGDVDILTIAAGNNNIGDIDVATIAAGNNNIGDVDVASITAGDNNIGNVDVLTVPADPFGVNADAASATGSISAKLRFIASTGIPITGTVTVAAHAVTNAGVFVVQENGAALTSLQLIDDVVHSGDVALNKYAAIGAQFDDAATGAVTENQVNALRMSSRRALLVEGVASGTNLPVSQATASALNAQVVGNVANAASDSGNPVKIGGVGHTANPTAVTDGQRVDAMFDKLGKQVTVGALRDLKAVQKTTITSSTSETTIITAAASTFHDVYSIIISNTSATVVDVTIKDATAGTTRAIITVPADDVRGFTLPVDSAIPQASANNNWTATCGASVASVEITALYVKNL